MKIKGSGTYSDSAGKSYKILGVGELADGTALQSLKVSGKVSFEKLSCDKINTSGNCEGGSISAQILKTSGELLFDEIFCDEADVSGKCEGNTFTAKSFSASGKVNVDSMTVEQTLKLSGKPKINNVTADEIFIATHDGFIGNVKCRQIKILDGDVHEIGGSILSQIFGTKVSHQSNSRVRIKNIEADTVKLENCEVEVVKCQNALIGTNCAITKLFVAGECKVADDSTVDEVIRT